MQMKVHIRFELLCAECGCVLEQQMCNSGMVIVRHDPAFKDAGCPHFNKTYQMNESYAIPTEVEE